MIRDLWRRWQAFRHRRFIEKIKPFQAIKFESLGVAFVWNKKCFEAVGAVSLSLSTFEQIEASTRFHNNQWLLSHGHIELTTEMMANEPDPERRQELAKARLLYCLKKERDDEVQN